MSTSEHESDFSNDEDEQQQSLYLNNKKKTANDVFNTIDKEDDDDFADSDVDSLAEDDNTSIDPTATFSKTASVKATQHTGDQSRDGNENERDHPNGKEKEGSNGNGNGDGDEDEDEKINTDKVDISASSQPKTLDEEQLKKEKLDRLKKLKSQKKSKHKTGVVYMSKIPPYMKPAKVRQVLSRFGEVDRLFLKREDETKYKRRVHSGGNKKIMFEEGWAEFIRKKDAKLCATTLNGNIIGGNKRSFYYDDVLNIKYLSGFKWSDLTEQIAKENDIRQSKLELEISQANKLNAEFIRNVEKSKMINNIKKQKNNNKRSNNEERNNNTIKQRKIVSNRVNAPEHTKQGTSKELKNVLSNLF
ncbi:hypothetical protein ACO0QE_000858 [Hanseniaspora vineae]